jgi:hypothetical protein
MRSTRRNTVFTHEQRHRAFWGFVSLGPDCWEWAGGLTGAGYGMFSVGPGKSVGAHRFSFEMHYGQLSDGAIICHKCDNRRCVRPTHMFVGDHTANARDKAAKGRWRGGQPRRIGDARVVAARAIYAAGGASITALARELGVNRDSMQCALRGITYVDLPGAVQ